MGAIAILIVAAVIAVLCIAAYFFSPKGPDQTLYRTSIILALICMYLMWAITYMAQLNPLISPRRSDLKPSAH
ncbi:H(+)-transporting V0 sector ATPase subunit e [Basidiobolus ranarum]|uniref:H(+)-transporting V0 sector ATPase subunit e n=1 Tax=Basidiobolus ranarum TaxID=34480 RepID=A0ABR2W9Z7_9FUNG